MDDILQELRKANTRLSDVTNRRLEEASTCSASTGSDEPGLKKRKVPPQVRVSLFIVTFAISVYTNCCSTPV